MNAIAMGVHVLDVLVRPVESIPEGQGGQLVDEVKMTAAGSAGGTALVLAKLGADVRSAGAVGTDALGDMLVALLERDGVDTSLLVHREGVQTSASVLPIRPDFHEQLVIDLPREVNREAKTIRHHDHISKDAIATKQYISLARHELHWSKRRCEPLQGVIEVDNLRCPIA